MSPPTLTPDAARESEDLHDDSPDTLDDTPVGTRLVTSAVREEREEERTRKTSVRRSA